MRGRRLLVIKLVIFFCVASSSAFNCDMATTARVQEGVLGQTPDFNWLGVLRVHLHDGDTTQVAVSGIVLIKAKYALGNADDVSRIPQRVFQTDTKAMFIAEGDTPWFVSPLSYTIHPEFEYSTFNSIAIIELNLDDGEDFPLNPICFPSVMYNTSNFLFLTGYTDENKLLEKVIYKIRYLDRTVCDEFYNRAGLSDGTREPRAYLCGFSPYNNTQCVWENGMALVSNATGWFTLIGFGIRGPGCAAPARFIDLFPYFNWIHTVTGDTDMYDSPDYRRQDDDIQFIPTHELFLLNQTRKQATDIMRNYVPYPFHVGKPTKFNIEPYDEDNAIAIFPFDTTLEMYVKSCLAQRVLIYREIFHLETAEGMDGAVTYKISLYDLYNKVCTCVKLTVDCDSRSKAVLSFKEDFEFSSGLDAEETPEHLFRYYPITERMEKTTANPKLAWKNSPDLKPTFVKLETKSGKVLNYDLYIKFKFTMKATLKFEMYADANRAPVPPKDSRRVHKQHKVVDSPPDVTNLRHWGMDQAFKRVKEPEVTVVAEHEVVQETVSQGCRKDASVLLIIVHLFLSICLRRPLLFI